MNCSADDHTYDNDYPDDVFNLIDDNDGVDDDNADDGSDDDSADDSSADDDGADDDSANDNGASDNGYGADDNCDIGNKRQAYSREYKLSVLDWHHKNGSIKNKTARHFNLSRQNVIRWIRVEVNIRKGKKGSKRGGSGRPAAYPLLERRLHEEFLELRDQGAKIRKVWFTSR
jgi:hypothetical protein